MNAKHQRMTQTYNSMHFQMRLLFLTYLAVVVLAGCTTQSVLPPNYAGPKAVLVETFKRHSGVEADFFGVERINGISVSNSRQTTRTRDHGKGIQMTPVAIQHEVPAAHIEVNLVGESAYGAPILELINRTYEIKGVVKFVARSGETYTIKGELGPKYSAIWIVDDKDNVIGDKIEKMED